MNRIIGVSIGTVMEMNLLIRPAPSTIAASYRSVGIFLSPARNSTMEEPNCHTTSRLIVNKAMEGLPSQSMAGMCR
ncbi:hypothetical protein D3C73_1259140 [compost metagenome]